MAFGKGCHLHLIDGSAFIFRAYHALPPLTRKSDGLPVGAVAGFCNMLLRYIENNNGPDAATHVAVIFDFSSKSFRNELYDQYKAHRPPPPEELVPQFPLTREATRAFGISCHEIEGYEADDIIATATCKAREAGGRVTIVSSDKDMMQLVGGGVEMLDPIKNKRIDREGVFEKFGVYPERVVDVQALMGDAVDNVPGAPGIGPKTAAQLIQEYGDLDALLARAGEIKQAKRRETLIAFADQIRLSRDLVTLHCDMPLDFDLDSLEVRDPDATQILDFLGRMEFRTLSRKVAQRLGVEAPAVPEDAGQLARERPAPEETAFPPIDRAAYETVRTRAQLDAWIARIQEAGHVAVDTETTSLNEMVAELAGISLATAPNVACYIPVGHRASATADLFGGSDLAPDQLPLQEVLDALRPVLEADDILKIGQNIKYDWKILARHGIEVRPFDDTMLLSYALHGGLHNHGMDELSERYLSHIPIPIKELIGSGKSMVTFDRVPIEKATPYAAEDADVTLRLWLTLRPRLHRVRVTTVYETLERPLVPVLAHMEMAGIKVDRDTLSRMSGAFAQKMAQLESEVQEMAGRPFNLGSPKQLGELLFDELKLPGGVKGKTGAYGTDVNVLEDLATEHPLPGRVLDWRQVSKLKSTYTDALQQAINADTGRVHTSYSIAGANTGRLASTDPNLQNIPVRTEEGRRIREAFVAEEGKVLVSLDYSQIELRLLAHMADLPELKTAFREGQDIHAITASEMFGVPLSEMTSELRRRAKAINFGIIYGISGFGLARNLRIPKDQAQQFIDRYFIKFPGIKAYMDGVIQGAKRDGFVLTLFGRKIHTPEINAKGPGAAFARRAAINAPIQGTAADIIRRAMIRMEPAIEGLPARMLLQVHDELLFEVERGAEDALIERARSVMVNAPDPAVKLSVPLEVEAGTGQTWAAAH
ncbi:DNA polymerase I [Rubellimicrobium rubrum]|uniref:DNA polymerase I n=1 Tax=Rubellimicrobium rubrum TaxID=2585369 RepID=A0A5C4N8A5_9RHOB|nr:DNA polymerase I [Rubellimicrobium rubrum]TNC52485.1 DNA polymerase I [Rubellimicrobium rubrum]